MRRAPSPLQLLKEDARLPPSSALQCVHTFLQLRRGHGQALAVDTKEVQLRLFALLREPQLLCEPALLSTALDCLEVPRADRARIAWRHSMA